MRSIYVDHRVIDVPSYDTATEAIQADMATPRRARALHESTLIAGTHVVSIAVSDQRIRVELTNGRALEIVVADRWIDWRISECLSGAAPVPDQRYPPIELVWPDGGKSMMNTALLWERRRSFRLRKLDAGQVFLNVYFERGGALQFLPLWNRTDQCELLYAEELEPIARDRGGRRGRRGVK